MFSSEELKSHLETSSTVKAEALVIAEWNMNMSDNIQHLGNYRYRPYPLESDLTYRYLPVNFDPADTGNFYTGATDADITISYGIDDNIDNPSPVLFTKTKDKIKTLYSLEDCVSQFRPRSGINKISYFNNRFIANTNEFMAQRPRYYMASKYDQFKYWTSYRTEGNSERGIANRIAVDKYYIDDTAPFVVYEEPVPANRIIVKMQTNVGTVNLGPFGTGSTSISDPLYGDSNKTVPVNWKIQYLDGFDWVDAKVFDETSPLVGEDGYLELQYGLIIPEDFKDSFVFVDTLASATLLPTESLNGYAYLVIENPDDIGTLYIWDGLEDSFREFTPQYDWYVGEEDVTDKTAMVTSLVSPKYFVSNNKTVYREFQYLRGIRIVVETMNKFDSTFDLIEMSPRLVVDITDKTESYSVTKVLSDLNQSALPVGQLLASTGSISIFDYDQSFNSNNTESIIHKFISKNIKFNFFEKILNVEGYNYYLPIKTLYSEGIPEAKANPVDISIELRDMFFFLESMPAPSLLATNASLSYAIASLLDYIGFSNYTFKRAEGENEPIIPYFFIAPDQNVAEVLNKLAVSTQSAMFFDEYNNFVVMSKDYILPSEDVRGVDYTLVGTNNQTSSGVYTNQSTGVLQNIESISSKDKKVFNDGKISYTTRYIQRSYGSLKQAAMVDKEKTWIYKPALLWEVSGTDVTKTINELPSQQSKYVLGAMPLNSDLNEEPPTVVNGVVTNNTIDLGENVYWLTRNQGYFYSNGEILRYDAVQFNVTGTGNVWISNNQEYQNYFSKLPFNGKIYPTGLVRIFSTPYYETVDGVLKLKNGAVLEHGRGQFGTQITSHYAGLSSHWSDNANVNGCYMQSQWLFNTKEISVMKSQTDYPSYENGVAGKGTRAYAKAIESARTGIIKNFMSSPYLTETEVNRLKTTQSGTVQSSAFILNGPVFSSIETPLDFITYVNKPLNDGYKHFGTRMRIIGRLENDINRLQTPVGSSSYYQVSATTPTDPLSIDGGSGGVAIMLNPNTNAGYYFEIAALTSNNIEAYMRNNSESTIDTNTYINNVLFYKIQRDSSEGATDESSAVPVKLWGGLTKILVDDGKFTGQYRVTGEENPTVYDLSVEYQDIGRTRRFFLYINSRLIATVDDPDPLPIYNNIALFTRGASRCMFENVYALTDNYSQNTTFSIGETLTNVFSDKEINANDAMRKYSLSGIVQATYLSGLSAAQPPKFNMYYEEFGTIMRECAYFNIKYDKAFPALYAKLSPTFNNIKGYVVSGFYANSYGAEFLIFNATDTALSLDETTGNYLRIQGITFTQDTTYEYNVDEYFKKNSTLSNPEVTTDTLIRSALVQKQKFNEINSSRMLYGKNEFSLDTPYIQTQDDAEALMGWIINKIMKPRKSVGVSVFPNAMLQLGDIVTIDYKDKNGVDAVASEDTRFVIYNMEYSRSSEGPSMTLYLSEV